MTDLRREFHTPDGVKLAVDDVSMTMYEGQICALSFFARHSAL